VLRTAGGLVMDATAAELRHTRPGLEVVPELVDGDRVDVLTAAAADAQLLCVGTTGAGSARDLPLGSAVAAVLRSASCPVAVVPLRSRWSAGRSGVVAGLDGGPGSEVALAETLHAAALRGTELLAVHAWSQGSLLPPPATDRLVDATRHSAGRNPGWKTSWRARSRSATGGRTCPSARRSGRAGRPTPSSPPRQPPSCWSSGTSGGDRSGARSAP
jgi:hypothetical protein